jgi:hypothetical protein
MTGAIKRTALAAAVAFAAGLPALPAQAQTAYDINRLNQAVQICNSPMGAGMAECAQLRARLGGGGGGGVPGLGGLGGFGGGAGKAAGIAGLLGAAMTAARSQQAAAAPPPAVNPGAVQQAISTCVQNAGGNNAAIQACLQIASAAPPAPAYGGQQAGYAAPASNPFGALLPKR